MNWMEFVAITCVVLVPIVIALRRSRISADEALERLRNGGVLVDVRSENEFAAGHLPGAINLPFDAIATTLPVRVPNKGTVLLLHCESGGRSGEAQTRLRSMGYTNAFNLGSYTQAAQIVARR
jgi:phage shock protein E